MMLPPIDWAGSAKNVGLPVPTTEERGGEGAADPVADGVTTQALDHETASRRVERDPVVEHVDAEAVLQEGVGGGEVVGHHGARGGQGGKGKDHLLGEDL